MTTQLDLTSVKEVIQAPLWPGIGATGIHRGLPTPVKLRIGNNAYRVYCKRAGQGLNYYILRHGQRLSVPETLVTKT